MRLAAAALRYACLLAAIKPNSESSVIAARMGGYVGRSHAQYKFKK